MRTKEERRSYFVKIKELKNVKNGILKAKEILAMKNREIDDLKRKNVSKKGEFHNNLWEDVDGKIQVKYFL